MVNAPMPDDPQTGLPPEDLAFRRWLLNQHEDRLREQLTAGGFVNPVGFVIDVADAWGSAVLAELNWEVLDSASTPLVLAIAELPAAIRALQVTDIVKVMNIEAVYRVPGQYLALVIARGGATSSIIADQPHFLRIYREENPDVPADYQPTEAEVLEAWRRRTRR